jgi:eukaryotic-like serine/threonine-protein kinase
VKGKIAYMPPEQLSGAPVNKQVDIYAASVVLWEALTNRRLFDGETEAIVLARAIEGAIEPPSIHNSRVEPAVDAVVLRGLSRDPEQRYVTAREMALAIEQTVGLASPSEVGEWVEMVSGDELARRAQTIAEIEVASLKQPAASARGGGPSPLSSTGEPHSQVSSISVSRPAISVPPPPRRFAAAKLMVTGCAILGIIGGGLGAMAMRDVLAGARHAEPNRLEADKRRWELIGPTYAVARTPQQRDVPVVAPHPLPPPPPVVKKPVVTPPPPNNCDPPFILDANGRRKYKMECLK